MNIITCFKDKFSTYQHPGELKKFTLLGLIFCMILAAYWTLGTIKESFLSVRIGTPMLPYAKIASFLFLVPTLWIYSKMLARFSHERLFITLSLGYAIITVIFAYFIGVFGAVIPGTDIELFEISFSSYFFCFLFYAFVESYGSLMVALFWAIATYTTKPDSAKKGFPFIVLLGQIGGIIGPLVLCKIPRCFQLPTSSISVYLSAVVIGLSCVIFIYFLRTTPSSLLQPFYNSQATIITKKHSFFEGLILVIKNSYLIGIFLLLSFYEFISQLFDYYFKCFAAQQFSELYLAEYIAYYGSAINFTTLVCLLFGINTITTSFGIIYALLAVPIFAGISLVIFMFYQQSIILLIILILLKAVHFSLTIPTTKQLYIPTTSDVQFKAQPWIDTFGSRIARQTSGLYQIAFNGIYQNTSACLLASSMLNHYFCLLIVLGWIFIARFVAIKHDKAIEQNKPVC